MDARIAAAFADDARSADVSILLAEVEAAASAAEANAEAGRARAVGPAALPRRCEACASRNGGCCLHARSPAPSRNEADGTPRGPEGARSGAAAQRAEAPLGFSPREPASPEEMAQFAEPVLEIARLLAKVDVFDQEIRSYNLRPTRLGHVRPVLSGDASIINILLQRSAIRGAFTALVAREIHKA